VAATLGKIGLRVHQDIHFNTSTVLDPGEMVVVFPAQTRYEQRGGGTSTSTERRIRFSPEIPGHPRVGESKPEYEIPALIARAVNPALASALDYRDSQDVRDEMDRTMPVYKGIAGLKREGDWVQWGGPLLCTDGKFTAMPDERARFVPLEPPDMAVPEEHFFLTNRRGKQFNSMVFEAEDRIQGGRTRDDVFASAQDAAELGAADGERVRLTNEHGAFEGILRVSDIKPGHLQAYWPEVNALIPTRWDPLSEEPDYNAIVRLERL